MNACHGFFLLLLCFDLESIIYSFPPSCSCCLACSLTIFIYQYGFPHDKLNPFLCAHTRKMESVQKASTAVQTGMPTFVWILQKDKLSVACPNARPGGTGLNVNSLSTLIFITELGLPWLFRSLAQLYSSFQRKNYFRTFGKVSGGALPTARTASYTIISVFEPTLFTCILNLEKRTGCGPEWGKYVNYCPAYCYSSALSCW